MCCYRCRYWSKLGGGVGVLIGHVGGGTTGLVAFAVEDKVESAINTYEAKQVISVSYH